MNEIAKRRKWESVALGTRYMVLMALYRLDTAPITEHGDYLEIYRYRQSGITREDLPVELRSLEGEQFKKAAQIYTQSTKMVSDLKAKRPDLF